jgi:isochorismate synthase
VLHPPGQQQGAQGTLKALAAAVQGALAHGGAGVEGFGAAGSASGAGVQLPEESAAAQHSFMDQVAAAQRALGAGLGKVVLARARPLDVPLDATATLWALRQQHPTATCFRFSLPGGEHFMGATPETLVRLDRGVLRTEALAGTAPRGPSAAADAAAAAALLASPKDRAEHDAVVQGLTEALGPLTEGLTLPPAPQTVALRQMWHLQTPIEATARPGQNALSLTAALHPTPALGGQPVGAATAYLRQHEPWRRGLYAAPLGWLSLSGDGVLVAGIRSLWCDAQKAQLFAGAGIVAQSSPVTEWQETALKLSTAGHGLRRPNRPDPQSEEAPL